MKARSLSFSTPTKPSSSQRGAPGVSQWTKAAVLRELQKLANPKVRSKMAYFGVNVPKAHGISVPVLHAFAKHIGRNQSLAQQLWPSGIHEAKILAALIGEPQKISSARMERWLPGFDSWDVVDSVCCYLYADAAPAWKKVFARSSRRAEFEKRAAFSLAAYLSYKDHAAPDARFAKFLAVIEREAGDERHFVKKAVNWALRNIGKRNSRRAANSRAGFAVRAMDCRRRSPRTPKRRGPSPPPPQG